MHAFLLKRTDLEIEYTVGGPTTSTVMPAGCCITHIGTGVQGKATSHKERSENRREAFFKLAARMLEYFEGYRDPETYQSIVVDGELAAMINNQGGPVEIVCAR